MPTATAGWTSGRCSPDGLILARALKVLDHGVLVGEPPNIWLMRDTDGDLRADTKTLVTDQFGRRDGDPQNNANGLYWARDNRMYTAGQVEVHLRLKNGTFEVHQTLLRGEWGVAEDDAGRIYRNTNDSALHVDLVPTAYFARNPNLLRTRGSYERLRRRDNEDLNTIWPVRPNPGTNRAYQTGIDRPDGSLAMYTAVCAPLVYRGDRLPAELYGNAFVAEPAANLVSRIILSDDGGTLRARKAYDRGEFLASTDERFRPVHLSNAPDGTLYVVDMYRGILEHRNSLTLYLRDHILASDLVQPTGFGRIYRVVHDTTRRDTSRALSTASPAELVASLSHPGGWRRDTAQRLLVERGSLPRAGGDEAAQRSANAVRRVIPALVQLAGHAKEPRTRLHALWTLDGIDAIDPATVVKALEDPSRDVRVSAIRIAERWLGEANHPIQAAGVEAPGRCGRGRAAATGGVDWRAAARLARNRRGLAAPPARRRSDYDGRRAQRVARQRSGGSREAAAGKTVKRSSWLVGALSLHRPLRISSDLPGRGHRRRHQLDGRGRHAGDFSGDRLAGCPADLGQCHQYPSRSGLVRSAASGRTAVNWQTHVSGCAGLPCRASPGAASAPSCCCYTSAQPVRSKSCRSSCWERRCCFCCSNG